MDEDSPDSGSLVPVEELRGRRGRVPRRDEGVPRVRVGVPRGEVWTSTVLGVEGTHNGVGLPVTDKKDLDARERLRSPEGRPESREVRFKRDDFGPHSKQGTDVVLDYPNTRSLWWRHIHLGLYEVSTLRRTKGPRQEMGEG